MAGIFPDSGIPCNQGASNAQCGLNTVGEDCPPLFYSNRCNVVVSPQQVNALISEIANAANTLDPLVGPYDCSRLDNLKNVLTTIRNLCTQPDRPAVEFDDYLAGCFDGQSGKINVGLLADLILAEVATLCELPVKTAIADTDSLAGCIGGVDSRITIANLKSSLGGNMPALIAGARFAQSTGPVFNNINVGSRQQLLIQGSSVSSGGLPGGPGRVGDFTFTNAFVTGGGTSDELVYYPISGNAGFGSAGSRAIANEVVPCYRIRDSWYAVHNGVATYIGAGGTLVAVSLVNFYDATILA